MANLPAEKGTITLQGKEIEVRTCMASQADLKFFPENPRIYSIVHGSTATPHQKDIEKRLRELEHVKQLAQAIKANGGLIDPLIVREGDNVVLEGNSRLAAYRMLAQSNAIRWGHVKCTFLPSNVEDDLVFALLGEYHIIGKKDWAPFEQAGYLWRRCKQHGVSAEKIGKEMGLSVRTINRLVRVYQFMVDHNEEDPQRWSYYEEYLKHRKVQQQREENPDLDIAIVKKIRAGEIPRAVDVRDKVVKIVAVGGKTLRKFIEKEKTLDDCFESAVARGANNQVLNNIEKFKATISHPDTKKEILEMPETQRSKCKYALEKIQKAVEQILKKIE